jgi:hypothetical protein
VDIVAVAQVDADELEPIGGVGRGEVVLVVGDVEVAAVLLGGGGRTFRLLRGHPVQHKRDAGRVVEGAGAARAVGRDRLAAELAAVMDQDDGAAGCTATRAQRFATASILLLSFSLTRCDETNGSMIRQSMPCFWIAAVMFSIDRLDDGEALLVFDRRAELSAVRAAVDEQAAFDVRLLMP